MTKEEIIEAVKFATTQTELSSFMLQQQFKKGYNWADKMMYILEKNGIIAHYKKPYRAEVLDKNTYEKIIVIDVDSIEP